MAAFFLDEEDLKKLTGKEQHTAQKRFLKRKNIPFDENAIGEVLVLRSVIERRLSGDSTEAISSAENEPNFGFLVRKNSRGTEKAQ